MDFDALYNHLESYIAGVKNAYLNKHITNQLATPEEYDLDIKSLCVLCHAAFEEFVERVALKVMTDSIDEYQNNIRITKPIVSLMHFMGKHDNYLQKKADVAKMEAIETIYDYNRKKLNEIKTTFSKEIRENHGVSLKYLITLLIPISIDIPQNPIWVDSLDKLANERGAYAHKFLEKGKVKQSIDPGKANNIIDDCLELCKTIRDRAKTILT